MRDQTLRDRLAALRHSTPVPPRLLGDLYRIAAADAAPLARSKAMPPELRGRLYSIGARRQKPPLLARRPDLAAGLSYLAALLIFGVFGNPVAYAQRQTAEIQDRVVAEKPRLAALGSDLSASTRQGLAQARAVAAAGRNGFATARNASFQWVGSWLETSWPPAVTSLFRNPGPGAVPVQPEDDDPTTIDGPSGPQENRP